MQVLRGTSILHRERERAIYIYISKTKLWRLTTVKIIVLNGVFSVFSIAMSAMCHYQRVNVMNYTMLFKVLDPPQFYPFYQFSMHRELYVYENMEQKQVCKKEENIHSCFRNPVHSNSRVRKPMSVAFTTDPARN